jgi:hypothetical protein
MALPTQPITLTPAQIADLNKKLGEMRHNVNNNLALMVAALELLRRKPDTIPKMADAITAQTDKLIEEIRHFSAQFDSALSITRDPAPTQPQP